MQHPDSWFRHRRVLVIGGEGFLAQNTIRRLVALEAHVDVLVRQQRRPALPGVQALRVGDVREMAVAKDAVRGQEVVFNFAGVTSAVTSNSMPSVSLLVECLPHLTLLDACTEERQPPLVVFPSSRLVYGKPIRLPVGEEHSTHPLTVYAIHKLAVEQYLRVYHATRGVPFLAFRISNPYGPYQNDRRGYGILNTFIQRALAGQPITLFGDGDQLRDFIHVDDLVSIMLSAVATPGCHNDVYNVGGPQGVALGTAARLIAELTGVDIQHRPWPEEHLKVETGDFVGSMDKLRRWLPDIDFIPLHQGIASTVDAYRDRLGAAESASFESAPAGVTPLPAAVERRVA